MRKKNAQSLNEILKELLQEQKLDTHLYEMDLIAKWPSVVGPAINNYTTKLFIRNGTLFVYLSSSVLRNELMMHRQQLMVRLNEQVGTTVIQNIVLR